MKPRIVFMGTPEFAARSLEACLELGEVVAVVCQPDRPRGRGQEVSFSPVKELALARGLPVLQPERLKNTDFAARLSELRPHVCVVTAYGRILPKDVLAVPEQGCVNVHASLLPRFRGAAPIQWAIAAGDARTGVCLMQMDEGMDTGPVIARAEVDIAPDDTYASLSVRLADLGKHLLLDALPRYLAGQLVPSPQPHEGVVMAPMLKKEDGRLDFARAAGELERRLRAFSPWPGAFTTFEGKALKVTAARVATGRGQPGTVLAADARGVEIACAQGSFLCTELQPEGKRAMSAREFLAGRKVQTGSRPFGA